MWSTLTPTQKFVTLRAMATYGGSFVRQLAAAWMTADPCNSDRLGAVFVDLVARYGPGSDVYALTLKAECKEAA